MFSGQYITAMKLLPFVLFSALVSVPTFAASVIFNTATLPIFAATASALVLMVTLLDYRPQRRLALARFGGARVTARRSERSALAA